VKTNYILIDYENVQVESLALLKGEHFRVEVFLGPKDLKLHRDLVFAMQAFGDRGKYIVLEAHGPNALDFHIAYYLGVIAAADSTGFFHIISKDKGFDPLIQHLKGKGVAAARSVSIEAMPCFSQAAASTIESIRASDKGKPKSPAGHVSVDDMIKVVVNNLMKQKGAARPRTQKTLRNAIHSWCGKDLTATDIGAVCDAMVKHGSVKVDGAKVSYALPVAQGAA
jgi:PIN domain